MKEKEFVVFRLPDDPMEYKLCYDVNAICDVEAETGVNIAAALFRGGLNFVELRALLYGLLTPYFNPATTPKEARVTLQDAGDLLTRDNFLDTTPVADAIGRCVSGRKSAPTAVAQEVPLAAEDVPKPAGDGQSLPEIMEAARAKIAGASEARPQ